MPRLILLVSLVLSCAIAAVAANAPTSDSFAVSLAQQSVAALTGGASITDVALNASVISIIGSDNETGTGTFEAKGVTESRIDLNLNSGTRSDVRDLINGIPAGAWQRNSESATPYAEHNCLTDAVWFFPGLSSLTQTANPNFIFKYIGQEQHGGLTVQHIAVFQLFSKDPSGTMQRLSATDFYLDPKSNLPLAIGFNTYADNDMHTTIPSEIRFTNYQTVSGIQVPFRFQHIFNGNVVLDVKVTSALFNTGLADSLFTLQ